MPSPDPMLNTNNIADIDLFSQASKHYISLYLSGVAVNIIKPGLL
jgi:hypothetical protein